MANQKKATKLVIKASGQNKVAPSKNAFTNFRQLKAKGKVVGKGLLGDKVRPKVQSLFGNKFSMKVSAGADPSCEHCDDDCDRCCPVPGSVPCSQLDCRNVLNCICPTLTTLSCLEELSQVFQCGFPELNGDLTKLASVFQAHNLCLPVSEIPFIKSEQLASIWAEFLNGVNQNPSDPDDSDDVYVFLQNWINIIFAGHPWFSELSSRARSQTSQMCNQFTCKDSCVSCDPCVDASDCFGIPREVPPNCGIPCLNDPTANCLNTATRVPIPCISLPFCKCTCRCDCNCKVYCGCGGCDCDDSGCDWPGGYYVSKLIKQNRCGTCTVTCDDTIKPYITAILGATDATLYFAGCDADGLSDGAIARIYTKFFLYGLVLCTFENLCPGTSFLAMTSTDAVCSVFTAEHDKVLDCYNHLYHRLVFGFEGYFDFMFDTFNTSIDPTVQTENFVENVFLLLLIWDPEFCCCVKNFMLLFDQIRILTIENDLLRKQVRAMYKMMQMVYGLFKTRHNSSSY